MVEAIPVIMSKPMVLSAKRRHKTETRRLADVLRKATKTKPPALLPSRWRKVKPGDLLWVRETHYVWSAGYKDGRGRQISYLADDPDAPCSWTPSIHMPRWASRLTLRVEAVSIERLQDISDASAIAEGVEYETADPPFYYVPGIMPHSLTAVGVEERWHPYPHAVACFSKLWDLIHGAGAWASNPTVVAVCFTAIDANVDDVLKEGPTP